MRMSAMMLLATLLVDSVAQPTNIECTGIMAVRSSTGSPKGPWSTPQLVYNPSAKNATKEWYSVYGIDNPSLVILENGTSLLTGRTCSGPEHPWIARSDEWDGEYRSIDDSQPFTMNNVEDPFMWIDRRGNYHALHHWQNGDHNKYYNGGHSFSEDGLRWTFSSTPAYAKNISWASGGWSVMARRERPSLVLDSEWRTPIALFTSVMEPGGFDSWLQSQPLRQEHAEHGHEAQGIQGGGQCSNDASCNLNGVCSSGGTCVCDPQWRGGDCGELAVEAAERDGGYHRPGYNGWGGNPFFSTDDHLFHVFAVEMTYACRIGNFHTNSQIVHATSETAAGQYRLAPIQGGQLTNASAVHAGLLPAPNSTVLHVPFAHAPHTWRDPRDGALVVVFEGRQLIPDAKQKRCAS